jgi:predicted RNase H-like HicB family nuclease
LGIKPLKRKKPTIIMAESFHVIVEQDEDGWFISEVVELPGCHTQAKTLDELMKRTREAISLYLKCKKPVHITEKFVSLQQLVM